MDSFTQCNCCSSGFQYYESRVASEYHSIHVNVEDDGVLDCLQMDSHLIQTTSTNTTSTSATTAGGSTTSGKRRKSRINMECCVTHSYLPLPSHGGEQESPFYMEAFVMMVPPKMTVESAGVTGSSGDTEHHQTPQTANSAATTTTGTTLDPGSSLQPPLDQDSKQNLDRLQPIDKECFIILEGNLALYNSHTGRTNGKIFQSIIPISFCPSAIQLCQTVVPPSYAAAGQHTSQQKTQGCDHDDSNLAGHNIILFIVNGNEVKVYKLQSSVDMLDKQQQQHGDDVHNAHTTMMMEDGCMHMVSASIVQSKSCSSSSRNDLNENNRAPKSHVDDIFSSSFSQSHALEPIESLLTLKSPITTIHTFVLWNHHNVQESLLGLAMGGIDGTVRIVTFYVFHKTNNDQHALELRVANTSQYVVDGPIASLSFQSSTTTKSRIILYAGSICGFACSFLQSVGDPTYFERPILVVDGLWNPKLEDDDAVLSVCEFHYGGIESSKVIAIGTFSGRLLLFARKDQGRDHDVDTLSNDIILDDEHSHEQQPSQSHPGLYCFWHCTLPYPIHHIHVHQSSLLPELIVFTRRSIHLFRCNVDILADSTLERIREYCTKVI